MKWFDVAEGVSSIFKPLYVIAVPSSSFRHWGWGLDWGGEGTTGDIRSDDDINLDGIIIKCCALYRTDFRGRGSTMRYVCVWDFLMSTGPKLPHFPNCSPCTVLHTPFIIVRTVYVAQRDIHHLSAKN